jgi:hypothetical protein
MNAAEHCPFWQIVGDGKASQSPGIEDGQNLFSYNILFIT